jgi:PAS domain S-box-containing protein
VTFVMARSGRLYDDADLETLSELAQRMGAALESARSFEAEQLARHRAEEARDRMRRLQKLTEALSGALDRDSVVELMVSAGRQALGADAGFAWLVRDGNYLELVAHEHGAEALPLTEFSRVPLARRMPICDALRDGKARTFGNPRALAAAYPDLPAPEDSPFRAWAVVPFSSQGRAKGVVSFSFTSERVFSDDECELLSATVGQASIALERCLLLEAERKARMRERQLHVLAARLSSALTPSEVATIACEEAVSVLAAYSGAAAVKLGEEMHILGIGGPRDEESLAQVSALPLGAAVPIAEAVRRGELVWCPDVAGLDERYGALKSIWQKLEIRSWGAVPFTFEGQTVGSLAISCREERALDEGEREFLFGVGQLTAQALERARLYDAHKQSEAQLRLALSAARAGTWSIDLTTMTSTRDPSYRELLGVKEERVVGDFEAIHPDDRAHAREHFERALRDGTPYEPEVRTRRDDGTYTWIRAHGRVIRGPDGKPAMLAGVIVDIDEAKRASLRADEERRINETLHRLAASFTAELEHERLVQLITDELTELVGAELGAFVDGENESAPFALRTVARTNTEQFRDLPTPRATPLLAETLVHHRVLRLDDVRADPRHDSAEPLVHPAVRSYLAVPVVARSGKVFGSLLFAHSEVGRFTPAHLRLASSIASQAAIALENAVLFTTVREQKEQLEAAVERAQTADRRKDEFLAMLGHELRNPLAPIISVLELMDLRGQGALVRERELIRRQVQLVTHLIDDLLDVTRITGGKTRLTKEVVELREVLERAAETTAPAFQQRRQRLELEAPASGALVDADPARLGQVFQNLLTNAAKYGEVDSVVRITARVAGDRVRVEVADQGIGIDPELLPRIFELFVQGKRTLDRAQGGLGIGLAVAKSICELHGGTIRAESEGLGRGATFIVELPRATRRVENVPVVPPRVRTTPVPRRILVVDDNADAAEMLRELLTTFGHETALAFDGKTALELALRFKPEVALLDIGLPGMDGYELARRLRAVTDLERLQLIAVTGYGQDHDRARTKAAGFDQHVVKPVGLEELTELLETGVPSRAPER